MIRSLALSFVQKIIKLKFENVCLFSQSNRVVIKQYHSYHRECVNVIRIGYFWVISIIGIFMSGCVAHNTTPPAFMLVA